MSCVLDREVDELLRDAEQRLPESSKLCHSVACFPRNDISSTGKKPTAPKAPLNVRQPLAAASRVEPENDTAGPNWFNLPRTKFTPEFKRDWQILRMRGILDPKHQKKALPLAPPGYSQVGEIVPGPANSYGTSLVRREKRRTIFEEVTSSCDSGRLKNKYNGIQRSKASGKKAFYQRLLIQRRKRQN